MSVEAVEGAFREGRARSALRRIGIRERLVVAFVLVSILPLILFTASTAASFASAMDAQVGKYSGQVVAEISKAVSGNLDRLLALSESVIVNDSVQTALKGSESVSVRDRRETLKHLDEELSSQIYRFNKVHGIILFRLDGELLFETGYEAYRPEDLDRLRSVALGSAQNMFWTTIATFRGTRSIVLSRMVNAVDSIHEPIGSLLIMVDEGLFARETFRGVDMGSGSELFIASAEGTVISASSSRSPLGGPVADAELLSALRAAAAGDLARGSVYYRGKAGPSLVCASPVEISDWIVAARIPFKAVATVSRKVLRDAAVACLLLLALITVLARALFASLSVPLAKLSAAAASIRSGDFSTRIRDPFPDEVGQVSRAMDEASSRLEALIEEIRVNQEAKRRAEIEMLKSQIGPHFLFNTLDSLKWTAMLRGDAPVAEGIGALSSLLRNGALASEESASLELELDNLRSYALVMKLRYGEGFRLEIEASEPSLACALPRLLLQPIVENSIVHGAGDASPALVTIKVAAAVLDGRVLSIAVTDDGRGFAPRGAGSPAAAKGDRFSGIGLRNVAERLAVHYGEGASMRVESEPGAGTRVMISMPAEPWEGPCTE